LVSVDQMFSVSALKLKYNFTYVLCLFLHHHKCFPEVFKPQEISDFNHVNGRFVWLPLSDVTSSMCMCQSCGCLLKIDFLSN